MSKSLLLWSPGEPNGETLENCATLWVARGVWNDAPCDYPFYGSCFIEARPRMNLRGTTNNLLHYRVRPQDGSQEVERN